MEIPKHLQDLVLAEANLEKDGVEAFRHGDFQRCIQIMHSVVDRQRHNWLARLYLAMSHYSLGDIFTGAIHFRYLEQNCPDEDIREKSRSSLASMEQELKVTPRSPSAPDVRY